ncbi:MAG TPA: haloacid dehalogenase [Candidatus Thermoplasmatota archaeon]|nr:haloacid dehalogenase [Candidatus Thermoplasmatota archaeon]
MRNLDAVADALEQALTATDKAREDAIARSREIIRLAGSTVKAAHRGEAPEPYLEKALALGEALRRDLRNHPEVYHAGSVENALAELGEAALVVAVHRGRDLPAPGDLPITPPAYVLALGDLVGELRRFALDALMRGDNDAAKANLDRMEDAFTALMRFDFPSAVVEVRRKQDVARSLLERTRGEIAVALRGERLERHMDRLEARLPPV